MVKVRVKEIPVRYENETYGVGAEFSMKKEHVNEKLVEVLEEKTTADNGVTDIQKMTKNDLLDYAKTLGLSVQQSMKKEEIINLIEGESNGPEQSEDNGASGGDGDVDGDSGIGQADESGIDDTADDLFTDSTIADHQGDS